MTVPTRALSVIAALTVLGACGSTSSSATDAGGSGMSEPTFANAVAANQALIDAGAQGNATPGDAVRASGAGDFDGVIVLPVDASGQNPADLVAELDLDVNFTNNTISGEISDVYARDGTEFDGDLRLSNGTMTRTDANVVISVDANGTLQEDEGTGTLAIDATISGQFTGPTGAFIDADVTGTLAEDGVVRDIVGGTATAGLD